MAYLAVKECDYIVVVQLGELLEDLDLLAKQVLALRQVLLRDRLDRHHVARRLRQKKKISFILNSKWEGLTKYCGRPKQVRCRISIWLREHYKYQCTGRCVYFSHDCVHLCSVHVSLGVCRVERGGRMYGDQFHQVLLMSARHEEALSSFKKWDKRIRHLAILVDVGASVCACAWGERGWWGMCVCVCVCNMRKACCAVHIGDIWGKLSFLLPHTLPPIPQLP